MTELKNDNCYAECADCCTEKNARACGSYFESCSCCGTAQSGSECCGSSKKQTSRSDR